MVISNSNERAYIFFKLDSLAKDKTLPKPTNLRKKLRKLELEVQFQEDFPDEYKEFTENLKEKLKSKPYSQNQKIIKSTKQMPLEWELNLDDTSPQNRPKNKKAKKVPSPCVNTLMQMIHGHGSKTFQNSAGYFQPPAFTKSKLSKTFGIWISQQKFQKLQTTSKN